MSHLCRPVEHAKPTLGLCCHTCSSGWIPGLWQRPNSPGDPGSAKLCSEGPHHPGDSHDKLHCEGDHGERDRHLGNALGKCLGGLSFGSSTSYSHCGKWQDCCWGVRPSEYNEVVMTKDTIDAFSSHVIHARMGMTHTGEGKNIMTQALHAEDGTLPQGLTVQNAYIELFNDSKNVTVVVKNSMAYPQTLRKSDEGSCSHMVTRAPYADWHNGGIRGGIWPPSPKMTMKQRQKKLFEELDLSGLESWPPDQVDSAWSLLAAYHNIFSLEPSKLGCTYWVNMWSKSPTTPHSKNNSDKSPRWWKKFICTWEKCWIQVQFAPARMHGVMQWCWFKRRTEVYISV